MGRIFCLFMLFSGPGLLAKEVRIKFDDLRKLVETQNERILAATHESGAAKGREGHLGRSFLPRIEAHVAQESFQTGTRDTKTQPDYGARASFNLYNGGRDRLREARLQVQTQRKELEARAWVTEELGKARELYWTVVYRKNLLALIKEMANVNSMNLKAAQRRVRSGVATTSDRLEFEMNAIELKRKLGEAELGTRAASRNLLILLGFPPDDALLTETEITHLGEWESEIQHSHQDHDYLVKPYELRSVETDLAAKEVARTWIPRIDAYAGWNQYNQREEDPPSARERQEHVIGVRLEMSLFDGFSAQREAEALHKEALAAKLAALYYRKENEAHVETEFDELRFLHDRVHEADENIKSAQKYYRITQSEYARGVKNSPDVLGASEKLFDMKLKRLEMVRDFQIARSHVLSKIGK